MSSGRPAQFIFILHQVEYLFGSRPDKRKQLMGQHARLHSVQNQRVIALAQLEKTAPGVVADFELMRYRRRFGLDALRRVGLRVLALERFRVVFMSCFFFEVARVLLTTARGVNLACFFSTALRARI
jgi:hypothetical protein